VVDFAYKSFKSISTSMKDVAVSIVHEKKQLVINPKTGNMVYYYVGKYGPVIMEENVVDSKKNKYVSIPKINTLSSTSSISPEYALELLEFPKEICKTSHEHGNIPVTLHIGPYGWYVTCGTITMSVKDSAVNVNDILDSLGDKRSTIVKEYAGLHVVCVDKDKNQYSIKKGKKVVSIPMERVLKDMTLISRKECDIILKEGISSNKKIFFTKKKNWKKYTKK